MQKFWRVRRRGVAQRAARPDCSASAPSTLPEGRSGHFHEAGAVPGVVGRREGKGRLAEAMAPAPWQPLTEIIRRARDKLRGPHVLVRGLLC